MKRAHLLMVVLGVIAIVALFNALFIANPFIASYNEEVRDSHNRNVRVQHESIKTCTVDSDCEVRQYTHLQCGQVLDCFNKNEQPLDYIPSDRESAPSCAAQPPLNNCLCQEGTCEPDYGF